MKSTYAIRSYSIANFGKERNGDSFLFEEIEDENLLIAAVADGVSQQPCDWLASSTACKAVISHFKQYKHEKDIARRLETSISKANHDVIATEGKCHKMASTLSIVVCEKLSGQCFYANIGDSRIYSLYENRLELLTTDDIIVRKESITTPIGRRVVEKDTLTKVVGQHNLSFSIEKKSFQPGEMLILATDGFYEARKATFNKLMIEYSKTNDLQTGFNSLIEKIEIFRNDDSTIISVLYLPPPP
jgi:serine/threonine protein phosphatase PrpC